MSAVHHGSSNHLMLMNLINEISLLPIPTSLAPRYDMSLGVIFFYETADYSRDEAKDFRTWQS